MHKDIKARIQRAAEAQGTSTRDMRDALVVMGLLIYYHCEEGTDVHPLPVEEAVRGAVARARQGDKELWRSEPEDMEAAARLLSWQIERETGSE